MKKIEYMAPEVEMVEITEQVSLLIGSQTGAGGTTQPGPPPVAGDDEDEEVI